MTNHNASLVSEHMGSRTEHLGFFFAASTLGSQATCLLIFLEMQVLHQVTVKQQDFSTLFPSGATSCVYMLIIEIAGKNNSFFIWMVFFIQRNQLNGFSKSVMKCIGPRLEQHDNH